MRKVVIAAGVAAALALAVPVLAQTGGVAVEMAPGKMSMAQTVKVAATITAIEAKTRDVTLKGPQGREVVVTAGPEVKNFDKLTVGDQVNIEYVEGLTLELKKGGGLVVERTDMAGAERAKQQTGGAAGRVVTVVADVIATDPTTQTVTLKGPQRTVDLKVRDPEQFKLVAKGDQVEATFVQALAIAVEPTAKK